MAKLNWERNLINRKAAQHGLSLKDEAEFRKSDTAARWIERHEQWLAKREQQLVKRKPTKPVPPLAKQKPARTQSHRPPATRFEDLDPADPHAQLPDVDLTAPPW